jgi:hypothetical protein
MRATGGSTRIKAFGLFSEFSREGLGSLLLTRMIEKSFATGAEKVTFRTVQELPPGITAMFRNQGFRILAIER